MAHLQPRSIRISITVYGCLLLAFPPSHRELYGRLMRQLFRDLCQDAYTQTGWLGLARLWIRTLPDLAASLAAAYQEAAEEVLMLLNRAVAPVSWGSVALVVVPGLLFGISRVVNPMGWPAALSFLLVAALAIGALVVHGRLPLWGLLALGLLTSWALQWVQLPLTRELARPLMISSSWQPLIMAIPLWLIIIWLLRKYHPSQRNAAWATLLLGLASVGAASLTSADVLLYAGLVLLPVALGLPLSRQYGSLASLFVLGVFSYLVLFDSDYYSGDLINSHPLHPLYVIPLIWMLLSVAPLLLLRAQTLRGRAIGLLAPALVWGTARIAVPLLFRPGFHPLSVWLGDALVSAFVLFVLALAFYLYAPSGRPITPSGQAPASHTVFNG